MTTKYLQEDLEILAKELYIQGFAGSTILVTGATGLIGSLCVKAIIEYNKLYSEPLYVIAMVRNREKAEIVFADYMKENGAIPFVSFIVQDVTAAIPSEVACDYIIHTANSTNSKYFMTNPVEVIDTIYIGTKRILDYAVTHTVSGIVYLSSMEVFGKVNQEFRCKEEDLGSLDIHNVRSCYSEGKRHAELMCKCYAEEYSVPVRVARLAQTFGAGVPKTENRVFAQFARSALKGEDIILHTCGRSVGNYCYTRDTVRALFLLLKKGEAGAAYTVVNEDTTRTIAEMAHLVAEEFSGGLSRVVFDIPDSNEYGYAPETNLRLSAEKLKYLGWHAEVGLEEMYERMIPDL